MKERRKQSQMAESPAADPVEVAAAAQGVVDGPPPSLGPRLARADELAAEGHLSEAVDAYTAVTAAEPENLDALIGLGSSLLGLVQYEAAEREFRKALRIAPNSHEVHYQLGLTLFRRGNYPAATVQLRRAVEIDGKFAPAYIVLGEALNQTGDPEGAVEVLEEAIRLQPESGRAFYALGIAYDRKGQPERAAEMYRRSREVGGR